MWNKHACGKSGSAGKGGGRKTYLVDSRLGAVEILVHEWHVLGVQKLTIRFEQAKPATASSLRNRSMGRPIRFRFVGAG
jgi:hypothetical protein